MSGLCPLMGNGWIEPGGPVRGGWAGRVHGAPRSRSGPADYRVRARPLSGVRPHTMTGL